MQRCPICHLFGIETDGGQKMTNAIPNCADSLLRRKQTAAALTEAGFPITEATLATKAARGGGPPFRSFGRIPLYRWGDTLAWAYDRLSPPRRSSSEADLQRISV
jgi:hypothetical protein